MREEAKKILIVDDQETWCETISRVLEEVKCVIHSAKTYDEARTKIEKENYSLAIVDIRLQEEVDYNVDGIDLLEWIHKYRQGQPPSIILTGHLNQALKQKAEWYGAYSIIEKSYNDNDYNFDRKLFLETVKKALQ